jgi:hypothetical protein
VANNPLKTLFEQSQGVMSADESFLSGEITKIGQRGVLSTAPEGYAQSPKFAEYPSDLSKMARLVIPVQKAQYNALINSVPARSKDIAMKLFVHDVQSQAGYLYFLLTQVQEARQEKLQVAETAGDNYVAYAFGGSAPVFNYSGVLMNTQQDDWRTAFVLMYEDYARATALANRRTAALLVYDNVIVAGAMTSLQQMFSADSQRHASFSFSFLVKSYTVVSRNVLTAPDINAAQSSTLTDFSKDKSLVGLVGSVSGGLLKNPSQSMAVTIDSPVRSSAESSPPTQEEMVGPLQDAVEEAKATSPIYPDTDPRRTDAGVDPMDPIEERFSRGSAGAPDDF